jgi:hypothetical protein
MRTVCQMMVALWLNSEKPTGQALHAIVDLDLDELASIEPPRDFGRD